MFIFREGPTIVILKKRVYVYLSFALLVGILAAAALYLGTGEPRPSVISSRDQESVGTQINLSPLIKKCNDGDADQCLAIGYIHLRGVVGDRDFLLAKKYFEKACDGYIDLNRKELQCEAIARIFDDGKEARVDRKISVIFHEKAREAHLSYVSSKPDERSQPERCDQGDRASCFRSALKFLEIDHRDLGKAQDLLSKACNGRTDITVAGEEYPGKFCGLAAELFEYGREGLPVDLNRAGELYFKACHIAEKSPQPNGFMCDLAGVFFRDKKSDRKIATSSFRKACAMKSAEACEHLQKLEMSQDL